MGEHDAGAGTSDAVERASDALVAAADALCELHAYADAARTLRTALSYWPAETNDAKRRLDVLDRLARCAELCSEHAEAAALLAELADYRARSGDVAGLAGAARRLATVQEVRGDWQAALAARSRAASAFNQAGMPGEAAIDRLAVAAHQRSAASYSAALATLSLAAADAAASGRDDLALRVAGLRGNVVTRLGDAAAGLADVRDAIGTALRLELPVVAAELQQRLADSLEHAGDYHGATEAYGAAYQYCDMHGADAVGHLCRACASAVLFNRGEWDLAVAVCTEVLAEPDTAAHPRAVSGCLLGLITALRGAAADARPHLLSAAALSSRIELVAVELLSAWGLAVLDADAGAVAAAADRLRSALALVTRTQERHYCVPMLQWAATFFTGAGLADDARACASALTSICESTGQPEAIATLAHVLGETLLATDPAAAGRELRRAAGMFGALGLPFAQAQAQLRAAQADAQVASMAAASSAGAVGSVGPAGPAAAGVGGIGTAVGSPEVGAGKPPTARELLTDARQTVLRLDAGPLLRQCARALTELAEPAGAPEGESCDDRQQLHRKARELAGLTARELDVMVLVAGGNTSREVGAALFISPRTVEMHVQGCLLKLGCRTRAEAVRKLTELGALGG
jgi:DNA-binding CsgD family transcriptional regulator/tetratricopeptide (TPR) repeat protein